MRCAALVRSTVRVFASLMVMFAITAGLGAYDVAARLKISLPGIDRETAQALVDGAHQVCTYSRATRGNVDLTITLV
jgi:organic hydroperoxide reductase OsmC/OhrA